MPIDTSVGSALQGLKTKNPGTDIVVTMKCTSKPPQMVLDQWLLTKSGPKR
jgi:hypothetical protein